MLATCRMSATRKASSFRPRGNYCLQTWFGSKTRLHPLVALIQEGRLAAFSIKGGGSPSPLPWGPAPTRCQYKSRRHSQHQSGNIDAACICTTEDSSIASLLFRLVVDKYKHPRCARKNKSKKERNKQRKRDKEKPEQKKETRKEGNKERTRETRKNERNKEGKEERDKERKTDINEKLNTDERHNETTNEEN